MTENQRKIAAYFWRQGFGTQFIAQHLSLPESIVYNNLEFIKTAQPVRNVRGVPA